MCSLKNHLIFKLKPGFYFAFLIYLIYELRIQYRENWYRVTITITKKIGEKWERSTYRLSLMGGMSETMRFSIMPKTKSVKHSESSETKQRHLTKATGHLKNLANNRPLHSYKEIYAHT